jgi:hypothetical protein
VWKKFLRRIGIGRTKVLAGALSSLQEALRLSHDLQAIITSQTALIKRYEKLESERPKAPINGADASGPRLLCEKAQGFRCRDANIQCGKDMHWN